MGRVAENDRALLKDNQMPRETSVQLNYLRDHNSDSVASITVACPAM